MNSIARFSLFFVRRWRVTFLLSLLLVGFGVVSYTQLLPKEGFPPVEVPATLVSGRYFADDSQQVSDEASTPMTNTLLELEEVKSVNSFTGANNFTLVVELQSDVTSTIGSDAVETELLRSYDAPTGLEYEVQKIDASTFINNYNLIVGYFAVESDSFDAKSLQDSAEDFAQSLQESAVVQRAEVIPIVRQSQDPATGQPIERQTNLNYVGLPEGDSQEFYNAIGIGVVAASNVDDIGLSEGVAERLDELSDESSSNYGAAIIGDFAETVNTQIGSLESNLLTGLAAVVVVTLLFVSLRGSLATVVFIAVTITAIFSLMYLSGMTLNTISLFALVLTLGLFVDDAIVIIESIDAERRDHPEKPTIEVIGMAIKSIGRASLAGTLTTLLVFAPLLFVSGVLGDFIEILPNTIILSLSVSLLVSLTVLPLLARWLYRKPVTISNPLQKGETFTSTWLSNLVRTANKNWKTVLRSIGFALIGIVSVAVGVIYAGKLEFNIFPPADDVDVLNIQVTFDEPLPLLGEQAESVEQKAAEITDSVAVATGDNALRTTMLGDTRFGFTERGGSFRLELVPFDEREDTSTEITERIETELATVADISTRVVPLSAGPPVAEFPFALQVYGDDLATTYETANEIAENLEEAEFQTANNQDINVVETRITDRETVLQRDGSRYIEVEARFSDTDNVSGYVAGTQDYLQDTFDENYLESVGLSDDALEFDSGQETDNAESFTSAVVAVFISLAIMYVLLVIQFDSFLQPLLIFLAIPFSFGGAMPGLFFTNNALSFFVIVGITGLIGIVVNNTIMLVDYANQARESGLSAAAAMADSLQRRTRPLLTTSITTIVGLLPLALSDPFWEPLAFTIIFGLAASTLVVITAFPYYYVAVVAASEWLGRKVKGVFS